MNKSIDELGAENVLATKSLDEKKQTESASENEESDTVSEQSSSSSSETTNTQNSLSNTSKSTNSKRKSNSTSTKSSTTVTQFSVQRSDVDGLRMKISAIRPTTTPTTTNNFPAKNSTNPISNTKQTNNQQSTATKTAATATVAAVSHLLESSNSESGAKMKIQNKNMHYNNNCLTKPLTVKLSNIKLQQQKNAQASQLAAESTPQLRYTATKAEQKEPYVGGVAVKTTTLSGVVDQTNNSTTGAVVDGEENTAMTSEMSAAPNTNSVLHSRITSAQQLALPLTLALTQQTGCLSDATAESGCSEATTAVGVERTLARRVRVKRKKVQSKLAQDQKKTTISAAAVFKSAQTQQLHNLMTYTSDSDDEPLQQTQQQLQQKRAPRILLTAISSNNANSNTRETPIKPLALTSTITALTAGTTATFSHGSDNSDGELKLDDVVNAAIKRVESDGDDTPTGPEAPRKSRSKRLPQYQSTLLQDFMEKTQMLGSSSSGSSATALVETECANLVQPMEKVPTIRNKAETKANTTNTLEQTTNVVTDVTDAVIVVKKKRGRPKKVIANTTTTTPTKTTSSPAPHTEQICYAPTSVIMSTASATQTISVSVATNINESADSGVISTTSTTATQSSTSPSPKLTKAIHSSEKSSEATRMTTTTPVSAVTTPPNHKRRQRAVESSEEFVRRQPSISPTKSQTQDGSGTSSPKPKIDIAYLDKRMYAATERVLYPPPRNKRRQSMSATSAHLAVSAPSNKVGGKTGGAPSTSASAAGKNITLAAAPAAKALSKEELQLDPVWRKIDVNKKFRRPSLSGYKSDGGGGNTTICSKVLAAKSGYVSDYGSFHARAARDHSGYKSDASGKSRYSMKSCISRRSRAKSCGYRSDCKDGVGKDGGASLKSSKYRRKRRTAALLRAHSKSVGNLTAASLNDEEKDILQLAGLSLGQSSEESNEYVCKPSLEKLPTTSASKKYGEINRFIATGEYFGRGNSSNSNTAALTNADNAGALFTGNSHEHADGGSGSQDGYGFSRKVLLQRKQSTTGGAGGNGSGAGGCGAVISAHETLLATHPHLTRKIKSRRSSIASYCSSFYSTTSKVRKRHRRKSFLRFPLSGKSGAIIDSKLLTEIDILINTFSARCRIQSCASGLEKPSSSSNKDKLLLESAASGGKLQSSNAFTSSSGGGKREQRDKRSLKKRKMSENPDYAFMSGVCAGGGGNSSNIAGFAGLNMLSGGGGSSGSGAKRRHKKANNSSSPDDHKLPLKKRHYLLTPGDKSTEAAAAAAVAAKLFGSTAVEAWAAAVASTKLATGAAGKMSLNQQQFGAICGSSATLSNAVSAHSGGSTKSSKAALTPKKRQFTQQDDGSLGGSVSSRGEVVGSNTPKCSNSSPLRITIDNTSTLNQKLLDISPVSVAGSTTAKQSDAVHRKRSRLEVLVSKIVATSSNSNSQSQSGCGAEENNTLMSKQKQTSGSAHLQNHQQQQAADTPPPGIFEPSVALEIQIPPTRLNEVTASGMTSGGSGPIVAKSEVNSPLMLQEMTPPSVTTTAKTEAGGGATTRVVETLLNKTGAANLLLKRKRKKINRTGFPNVRRRKKTNKISEQLFLDIVADEEVERVSPMQKRPRTLTKQTTPQTNASVNSVNTENVTIANELTTAVPLEAPVLKTPEKQQPCDRVPISGEASDSFLERANRTPRLSVVALERLRGTPTPTTASATAPTSVLDDITLEIGAPLPPRVEVFEAHKENTFVTRKGRVGRKPKVYTPTKSITAASKRAEETAINEYPAARKSRKNTTTERVTAALPPSTPTTPKSSKRARAIETPVKIITADKAQLLAHTNNALAPRPRGRRPKLSAEALLTNVSPQCAQLLTPPEQSKSALKSTTTSQINSKGGAASSPQPTKQTRRVIATTPSNTMKSLERPASFSKSTVHKIITAKSLEAKVKLPAGIDPNTNFSCKIRLKRSSTKKAAALATALRTQSMDSNGDGSSIKGVAQSTPEQIAVESAAKDSNIDYPEQNILPRSEPPYIDSEAATSDTSDEKCSTTTSISSTSVAAAARKVARLKKNYLPAGLFSEYFKQMQQLPVVGKRTSLEKREIVQALTAAGATSVLPDADATVAENSSSTNAAPTPSLPPPPYCEQYFRRTQIDFQLPYDIWWAYTNSKLPTRITVPSWNYRKIRTNIYADAVRPNTAGLDHPTCNCKPDQGCGDNCLNRMVYTECSPSSCPAREKCRNQKIQRHEVAPGVERFMTADKGWGVRTKLPIVKGTYILEYVGEVVTDREFKDRMGTIYLNDIHHYCLHLDGGLLIDGHRMGSDGRFVNHSCQPNCEMQKWSVNGLSRMALFAKRNIEPGEELSYDYNFSLFNPSEGQPCRCNTSQCRGVIGGKSQRIKPLPIENSESTPKDAPRSGRPRKRQARKNTERVHSKDVVISHGQQLSEKEKKFVRQHGIFLVRDFEKTRRCKAKRNKLNNSREIKVNGSSITPTPTPNPTTSSLTNLKSIVGGITTRRSSTPASLTGPLTMRSPRSVKTRGLAHAVQDPEVEKMAKIAVILREICISLESLKDTKDKKQTLVAVALANNKATDGDVNADIDNGVNAINNNTVGKKRRKSLKTPTKATTTAAAATTVDLKTVQTNIEQGYYKLPSEFNADMLKVFETARQQAVKCSRQETALHELITAYERKKLDAYSSLLEIVGGDASMLTGFVVDQAKLAQEKQQAEANLGILKDSSGIDTSATIITPTSTEDIIRCICGLHKDEGLMIQCARCMVWQHTECTKADVNADNYLCERCEPRIVDREIPLDDFTEDGHRYYLALMRGDLHVRQGDAVYVLRDIPIKDAAGNVVPKQKHTYETIGSIDYSECDIFRVERLWKNEQGKRFIFGHHFLRPHETFHEPSRRFYPNEVVRVPLYEIVPIELVIGRCWVLDRTTFCKGRPVECNDETHCYICELRVDKTARFFSKAKVNYPTCTKTYAFRKFPEKLKISKSYAPHDVDPALLKPKRQKSDGEIIPNSSNLTLAPVLTAVNGTDPCTSSSTKQSLNKPPQAFGGRKRRNSCYPGTVHIFTAIPPSQQTMKLKRTNLEAVLKTMKLKCKNTQTTGTEQSVIDLSYLLSGRRRKTQSAMTNANSSTTKINTSTSST